MTLPLTQQHDRITSPVYRRSEVRRCCTNSVLTVMGSHAHGHHPTYHVLNHRVDRAVSEVTWLASGRVGTLPCGKEHGLGPCLQGRSPSSTVHCCDLGKPPDLSVPQVPFPPQEGDNNSTSLIGYREGEPACTWGALNRQVLENSHSYIISWGLLP